jgi:predicted N-formylglutamate amidohydrolase
MEDRMSEPNRDGDARLAGEGREPVARVENPDGASPILLICEHASNLIPARYGDLGLGQDERESHIAWDPGALGVARGLSRALDAPLVCATVSRLVLDLNRDPSAPDSITTVSERTIVPGNQDLSSNERAFRAREVYAAFHDALDAFAETRFSTGMLRAVVSIHSFTPVYRDVKRPWEIGLIFDADDRYARAVEAGLQRDPSLHVGMNEPYSPADRVFHTLERHAVRRGLAPLMIEIRNDLIRAEDGQALWSNRLAPLLRDGLPGL